MKLNLFYQKNEENNKLEKQIIDRIKIFISKIKEDKRLKKHILSFWIIWPCARWQWFWFNKKSRSDVDFFIITSTINPSLDSYLKEEFNNIFEKKMWSIN